MTVTKLINDTQILGEMVNFLRNSDILTTTERNVTTASATGTLTNQLSILINVPNVKNIRSVTVATVAKTFGTDYTFNLNYNNSGTITCLITFTVTQTGAYSVSYDYGSDKIFDDFPRDDLNTLSSYPRMTVDVTSTSTDVASLDGSVTMSDLLISFYIWDSSKRSIRDKIAVLRQKILEGKKNFYYIRYLVPTASSPIIPDPNKHDKIVLKTLECRAPINEEITS